MKIFPAIDLKDEHVVRLFQGDYQQMTVYHHNPLEVALQFQDEGAKHLHMVDLDGAKDGCLVNYKQIKDVAQETDLFIQVGGGIRSQRQIEEYLSCGVNRVILGTIAVTDFSLLEKMVNRYGNQIAVGVDAKDGCVAIHGWKEVTSLNSFEFCKRLQGAGVETVIYTDIAKDGGMGGTNVGAYQQLSKIQGLQFIASGGICSIPELNVLKDTVAGAILGKALYTGVLDLKQVLAEVEA